MLTISFSCQLPHGIHARPASLLEQKTSPFNAEITLLNQTKLRQANAKSVLAMVGADVVHGDRCQLLIEGPDEQAAFQLLERFIIQEFPHCDEALVSDAAKSSQQALPVFLSRSTSSCLRGNGVSKGIAKGVPVYLGQPDLHALATQEAPCDAGEQRQRLAQALENTRAELNDQLANRSGEAASVLQAHIKLVSDQEFEHQLLGQSGARNGLAALACAIEVLCQPLLSSSSAYLRERALDIQDLGLRLATHLTAQPLDTTVALIEDAIVISQGVITPGQFLALQGPCLKGIVMGEGGETSHTVILARAFGVPLLCIEGPMQQLPHPVDQLLLDARHGVLVIDPDAQAEHWYRLERNKQQSIAERQASLNDQVVATQDGVDIRVLANIALAVEAERAFMKGADGVGLFRTEMLFCERASSPDEEEQYQAYRQVLRVAQGKKVVIRTLDIGGDKPCSYLALPQEENPFLGYRAVRIYPQYLALFTTQARALLRASAAGALHIMVPMVSTLTEVKWLHQHFHDTAEQLKAQGHAIGEWHLGIMVEVPSTLYLMDKIRPYVEFVSIGSNDLTQYFLACDRGNANVRHLYNYCEPTFLALMRDLVSRALAQGLDISLCGEMAGDPKVMPLLLGMGLRDFSVSTSGIMNVKDQPHRLDSQACRQLLEEALDCEGPQQVEKLLHTFAARQAQGILAPSLMLLDRSVGSKEEAIKLLTDNLELEQRVTTGALAEAAIWQREAVFSTALGFSVALPHCKSPDVLHNSISVLRLSEPLAWGDDVDVTLVIMLTVNENDQHQHMKIFSRLARKLMHTDFRERLISIPHSTELVTLLNEHLVVE